MSRANRKNRGANGQANAQSTPVVAAPVKNAPASLNRYTQVKDGVIQRDPLTDRLSAIRSSALRSQMDVLTGTTKTAGVFSDSNLGPSHIADSDNMGMYSFEWPVDAMEMPQSRMEELRFYRMAYDRDPIVGQAIDLHTDIPLSKMTLEKPKSSVDRLSDFIFDFFQRMVNDTSFYSKILSMVREQAIIGEAYLWCVQPEAFYDMKLGKVAQTARERGRGYQAGVTPASESDNGPLVGQEQQITGFKELRKKQSAALIKTARRSGLFEALDAEGLDFAENEDVDAVKRQIVKTRRQIKQASHRLQGAVITRDGAPDTNANPMVVTAAPGDEAAASPVDATPSDTPADSSMPEGDAGGLDGGLDGGGMDAGMSEPTPGGFAGGFDGGGMGDAPGGDPNGGALATADEAVRQGEIAGLKRLLHLLERKKELLEELQEVEERNKAEKEVFSHLSNENYEGLESFRLLPPENVSIEASGMDAGPTILYKPSESEKSAYLENPDVPPEVKEGLETNGTIELNQDPFQGSFVIHFARKKADYELHGRSMLQRCMRTIIYREKLRQVQTTLASRNMTPKSLITAPGVSVAELAELRANVDEAKADPDFSIITNYEVQWQEIGSESRLLQLEGERQHTNSDLAIGLGFTPEILIGEGMYGGNRIQLEILNTTYIQFRETLTDLIENSIFKPIAMIKGFFEEDDYKRPRWVYPKITFGRMGLRDSGDLYEMLFNLYARGALPLSTILDFLNIDPETVKQQLEDDLFTVLDSQFNQGLSNLYGAVAANVVASTDISSRFAQGLGLVEKEMDDEGLEGSGDGM